MRCGRPPRRPSGCRGSPRICSCSRAPIRGRCRCASRSCTPASCSPMSRRGSRAAPRASAAGSTSSSAMSARDVEVDPVRVEQALDEPRRQRAHVRRGRGRARVRGARPQRRAARPRRGCRFPAGVSHAGVRPLQPRRRGPARTAAPGLGLSIVDLVAALTAAASASATRPAVAPTFGSLYPGSFDLASMP